MTKNKIVDLRNHLFLALEKLHENEISVETAYAIAEVSKAIIDTAKVEVQYLKAIESNNKSLFLEEQKD